MNFFVRLFITYMSSFSVIVPRFPRSFPESPFRRVYVCVFVITWRKFIIQQPGLQLIMHIILYVHSNRRREILNDYTSYVLWYSEWGDRCTRNLWLPTIRTLAVDSQWTKGQDEPLIQRAPFWILLRVTTINKVSETATMQEVLTELTQMRRLANALAGKTLWRCGWDVCAFFFLFCVGKKKSVILAYYLCYSIVNKISKA